ncbi:hypothetical protein EV368DRAFT_89781 [Lentinula lateritia]|nr:hypothetical protein EV368DRAFT_89781 [Lentinula lateritia]
MPGVKIPAGSIPLHLLYLATSRDWASFSCQFDPSTTSSSHLYTLFTILESYHLTLLELPIPVSSSFTGAKATKHMAKQIYEEKAVEMVRTVTKKRDTFRTYLAVEHFLCHPGDDKNAEFEFQTCWHWISGLLHRDSAIFPNKQESKPELLLDHCPRHYFVALTFYLWHCTGTQTTPAHFQLQTYPKEDFPIVLTLSDCKKYQGNIKNWLLDRVDLTHSLPPKDHCYRLSDNKQWCLGQHTGQNFFFSVPVVLIFEIWVSEGALGSGGNSWNFPAVLPLVPVSHRKSKPTLAEVDATQDPASNYNLTSPDPTSPATSTRSSPASVSEDGQDSKSDIVYDFVGRILAGNSHFVARYGTLTSRDNIKKPCVTNIWTYDDMAEGCSGFPLQELNA